MFDKKTPIEKEWQSFLRREEKLQKRYGSFREPFWEKKLQKMVPEGLQEKLSEAFYKAFLVILKNGTGMIGKTFSKEKLKAEFKTREYAAAVYPARKNLAAGRKKAAMQSHASVAGACAEGAVLGLLGIGLPDIPIFLGVVLRSLYTLALHFGIDYEKPEEQELLLELIALSLYSGDDFAKRDAAMNRRLYSMAQNQDKSDLEKACVSNEVIRRAASALSGELLYMKFLQGIPIAGLIGGLYDGIYLKKITSYAGIKMERRYLLAKIPR